MASVDDLELDTSISGGVAFLRQTPKRDWDEDAGDGVRVATSASSRAIRVEGIDPSIDLDTLPMTIRSYANRALDLMAIRSVGVLQLEDWTKPLVVWQGGSGLVRTTSEDQSTFTMTVGGPPSPPATSWHESMRFFRMSQTTDDLLDAFRNIYLALESVLSVIAPRGRAEKEGAWLKRALGAASQSLTQSNAGMTFDRYRVPDTKSTADPVEDVFKDLWHGVRNSVFHAKAGRDFVLPQQEADRKRVALALERYAVLFTDLAEITLNSRFLRSGVGPVVADSIGAHLALESVTYWSDSFDNIEDFEIRGQESRHVALMTSREPRLDEPFAACLRGVSEGAVFPDDFTVRSVGLMATTGEPMEYQNLGGALNFAGFQQAEHVLVWRVAGGGLRTQYDT